jgi:DNA/RNA-binding domain of Phe-tRNA-synthetase-like protein
MIPIVDFYNSVSIKYAVTAGAFDLVDLCLTRASSSEPEQLELRLSKPEDRFVALDAEPLKEPGEVSKDELVYVKGTTVLTRHLAWRQAVQGLVTAKTTDVFFVSEVFNEKEEKEPSESAKAVAEDLVGGLESFFGVMGKVTILGLGIGKPEVEV